MFKRLMVNTAFTTAALGLIGIGASAQGLASLSPTGTSSPIVSGAPAINTTAPPGTINMFSNAFTTYPNSFTANTAFYGSPYFYGAPTYGYGGYGYPAYGDYFAPGPAAFYGNPFYNPYGFAGYPTPDGALNTLGAPSPVPVPDGYAYSTSLPNAGGNGYYNNVRRPRGIVQKAFFVDPRAGRHSTDLVQAHRLGGKVVVAWKGGPNPVSDFSFSLLDRNGDTIARQNITDGNRAPVATFARPMNANYFQAVIHYTNGKEDTIVAPIR